MSDMLTPRVWLPFAIVLAVAGCRDSAAPLAEHAVTTPQLDVLADSRLSPHILQQSPTAPPLETYEVSFWVRHDRESTIAVNYRSGQPFLRFHIPKFGLMWAPDGTRLVAHDSLLITMTLDTVNLQATFEPSGVVFSNVFAPQLVVYYENANPDLNGDGVVNYVDWWLERQLTIWGQTTKTQRRWFKVASQNDTTQQYVTATLHHFSQYAVCW
jgi:hypothetical protein